MGIKVHFQVFHSVGSCVTIIAILASKRCTIPGAEAGNFLAMWGTVRAGGRAEESILLAGLTGQVSGSEVALAVSPTGGFSWESHPEQPGSQSSQV